RGVRPLFKVFAPLQHARRPRRHLHHGTRRTHGPRSQHLLSHRSRLPSTDRRPPTTPPGARMTPSKLSTKTSNKSGTSQIAKNLELLFEIGAEEIPAGMLSRAEEELK